MDPRLLRYYNQELHHVREMGSEFAKEFPKIAGRLGMDGIDCADPYVERLLEGFAFLAARVQLKVDAEFPRFTQHLFELIYPHYLAPTPSMAVVQLEPDLNEGGLASGFRIPRGSALQSMLGKRAQEVLAPLREICLSLPETGEGKQFGKPVWKAGKKSFCTAYDYGQGLRLSFWVGSDMQAMLTFENRYEIPAYTGHNGWISLNVEEDVNWDEIRELILTSYRHFALKRMLKELDPADA